MKTVFFVFNGDPMCFVHVLLNALDMHGCGREVRVVMEGASVSLAEPLMEPGHPLHRLFIQVRQAGLLDGLCRACASKLGAAATACTQPPAKPPCPPANKERAMPESRRLTDKGSRRRRSRTTR